MNFFLILFILFFSNLGLSKEKILTLDKGRNFYNLGHYLYLYEDTTSKLDINEIQKPKWSKKFQLSQQKAPNFGGSSSSFWAKFTLNNQSALKRLVFIL